MSEIVTLLFPFFGLILLGYAAGYFRLINVEALAGIEFFLFYAALPVLFFQLIATTQPGSLQGWSFVATTTFATYCAFAIAFSIGALLNGGNVPEATMQGLVGSYSNTAYLAPALVIAAFGSAAAAPIGLIFSFDTAMLLVVTPLMMALGGTVRTDPARLAQGIARDVLLNPIIVAVILGFIAMGFGVRLPTGLDAALALLRGAATPVALFVVGVGLSFRALGPLSKEMPALIAVKLIAHPLIVYLLLTWIGGFDPLWVHTAVLVAALPPAANVVALARRYHTLGERTSVAVLLVTVIAIATVTLTLILILDGMLPTDPFR
ncbi:MAG TPA: AEC family transporter [Bauldia sp.]